MDLLVTIHVYLLVIMHLFISLSVCFSVCRDTPYIRTHFVQQIYDVQVAMKENFATVWPDFKKFMVDMDCLRHGSELEHHPPGWEKLKLIMKPFMPSDHPH